MLEKQYSTSAEKHLAAARGKTRSPTCRRGIPREVLEDPDLIIGVPSGGRHAFANQVLMRSLDFLKPPQKIVGGALMAGHAALESGGINSDRVRDDLIDLALADGTAALAVATSLVLKRLAPTAVATNVPDNGAEVGGRHD